MADYRLLKPFILKWEGGFGNDKDDLGGATFKGVTIGTFRAVFGKDKTVADLKRMTEAQWDTVFKKHFWDRWKADEIQNQRVANILVDWLWTSGAYGIRIPQDVLGVSTDGIVGSKTIAAVNGQDAGKFADRLIKERLAYIDRICRSRPQNRKFRRGWINRINGL